MVRLASAGASPAGVESGDVDVGKVTGRRARPGRALQISGFRVQSPSVAGRAAAAPGRGTEKGTAQLMLGESVQLPARGRGRAQVSRARPRSHAAPRCRSGSGGVPPGSSVFFWPNGPACVSRPALPHLRRRAFGGRVLASGPRLLSGRAERRSGTTRPSRRPGPRPVDGDDGDLREADTPLVVSVLPAQRRLAVEVSAAMTMQSSPRATCRARSTVSWGEYPELMRPPLLRC